MSTEIPQITVRCVPVTQPIGTFYVGAMSARDLVDIAWADIRRIAPEDVTLGVGRDDDSAPPVIGSDSTEDSSIGDLDENYIEVYDQDFEQFLGIQRELSRNRVKQIQQYVRTVDAAFPTGVLLAVSSRQATFDEKSSTISIVRHSKAAKVIDGQHRIAGLRDYDGPSQFDVNVAIFIDMDIQDQAMVFATINLTQTKVNKSLAYDLYEFTTTRSPQKSAHDIVRFLNYKENSPFQNKIKMLGTGSGSGLETITQATFVDRLLRYISSDPMHDREQLRKGGRLVRARGAARNRQIFRDFFIDERDARIIVILWNYFLAVQSRWPNSWNNVVRGNILNRSTGFSSLMRFLRVAYNSIERPSQVVLMKDFAPIFNGMRVEDGAFTSEEYLPGSSGETKLYRVFVDASGLQRYA